jgi:hypothetical protein
MSDQGDAGQWRPATSQNDRYSAPDDTTGPLPAVPPDEPREQGFPSMSPSADRDTGESASAPSGLPSWAEDDAPTGGFPAVPGEPSPAEPPEPPASPAPRSVFEPVDRTAPPPTPPPSFDTPSSSETPPSETPSSFDTPPSETPSSFDTPPSETPSSFDTPSFDKPSSFDQPSSFGTHQFDTHQYDTRPLTDDDPPPYEGWTEPKYDAARDSGFGGADSAATEDAPSVPDPYASYGMPPAPKRGVTAEDEDGENEFFASDDHPPMWDKVVAPSGPPPKPGKPSSGNLRLPDWMRDEQRAAEGAPDAPAGPPGYDDDHSRRPLYIGLGILVVGLLVAGGMYALKQGGDGKASNASAPSRSSQAPGTPAPTGKRPLPVKQLPRFKGVHTKAMGRVTDPKAGLSYARLAKPWTVAPKTSPMNEIGFSASQFAVTEKAGGRPKHWARLMSAQLSGAAKQAYQGPGTEKAAAAELIQVYEARMFAFRHRKRHLANQPLTVGGHKGWLVSDYVTYRRKGLKATGDVVALAVVDTGRQSPGVVFMSVPNDSRKLWPDINFVMRTLRTG